MVLLDWRRSDWWKYLANDVPPVRLDAQGAEDVRGLNMSTEGFASELHGRLTLALALWHLMWVWQMPAGAATDAFAWTRSVALKRKLCANDQATSAGNSNTVMIFLFGSSSELFFHVNERFFWSGR